MRILMLFLCMVAAGRLPAQSKQYESGPDFPYGSLNPEAPPSTADFAEMIGSSECISIQRRPDGTWLDSLRMIWNFSYIMNGTAVQDEVFLEDGRYAGSLRQYHPDSAKWYVSFYSSSGLPPYPVWSGTRDENRIILYRPNSVIQGQSGTSRLTFYDISPDSFQWVGEWLSDDGNVEFTFWTISCRKIKDSDGPW